VAAATATFSSCADDWVPRDSGILPYDTEWRRAGFTCDSRESGLYCWNAWGHGFMLSRERWETF
jgi:hypothetical protein